MPKIEYMAISKLPSFGDNPVAHNVQTYHSLWDRHSLTPVERIPSPDPSKFPAVQFTKEDALDTIHSFPAGLAGGHDGICPQHLRDLTSNKETAPH